MKNNYIYKTLFVLLLCAFFTPKNSYASVKYNITKSIVKDTTPNLDYRLSENEEDEILYQLQKLRSKSVSAILLYLLSGVSIGITGIIGIVNTVKVYVELQELEERLKDYPESDILKQKLKKVMNLNLAGLFLGALGLAFAIAIIVIIASEASALGGVTGDFSFVFSAIFGGLFLLILDRTFFRNNVF